MRNKFLEVELQEQMVHAMEIFTDFAKSPSIGAVSIQPFHQQCIMATPDSLSQTVLSVFWVPCCGPQKPRPFWPASPRLRTAPHQEEVARSQQLTDKCSQGTLHLLLQIQLCPRHVSCFSGFGNLRCSEMESRPGREVAAF